MSLCLCFSYQRINNQIGRVISCLKCLSFTRKCIYWKHHPVRLPHWIFGRFGSLISPSSGGPRYNTTLATSLLLSLPGVLLFVMTNFWITDLHHLAALLAKKHGAFLIAPPFPMDIFGHTRAFSALVGCSADKTTACFTLTPLILYWTGIYRR